MLRGFALIRRPGLRRFVVVPLTINIVLFASLIALGVGLFDRAMAALLPPSTGWLEYLLWPLFAIAVALLSFYTFTLVANLIGWPFNDRLSEAVVGRVREAKRGLGDDQPSLWREFVRALGGELRKWLSFLPLILGILLLWLLAFVLPPIALLVPILWFSLGAWIFAFEYLDYPLDNQRLSFADKRAWLRARRSRVLGFGAAALGLTMIPFVNFFVMPAAVAGATLLWLDETTEDE